MSAARPKPRFTVIEHDVWDSPEMQALSPAAWYVAVHMLRVAMARSKSASASDIDHSFDFGPANVCLSSFQYRRAVAEVIDAGIVERLPVERSGERIYFVWKLRPLKKFEGSDGLTPKETTGVENQTPQENEGVENETPIETKGVNTARPLKKLNPSRNLTPQVSSHDPLRNLTPPNTNTRSRSNTPSNRSNGRSKSNGEMSPEAEDRFQRFWEVYPRKQAKAQTRKAWRSLDPDEGLLSGILTALQWQTPIWAKADPKFTPLPSTYINGRRWEDEPDAEGTTDFYRQTGCVPDRDPTPEDLAFLDSCDEHD